MPQFGPAPMKQTLQLSNKTKAELTAMARRKKIPVSSGMVKDELIKTIKKGLRKIEAQKKSKASKQTSKKKSTKKSKAKTASQTKQTSAGKKTASKKSPLKKKVTGPVAKKPVARKPKVVQSAKTKKKPARPEPVVETLSELPDRYGDHRLVVMARDPNWAYAYWDLNPTQVRNLLKSARQTASEVRWILRVYSAALHPVEEKGHFFDVDIQVQGGNYYLNLSKPGARFIVEIGVMDHSGMFRSTAQSNPVIMPLNHPSDTLAPEITFSEDTTSVRVSSFTQPPSPQSE